jgi:hypothetical protein
MERFQEERSHDRCVSDIQRMWRQANLEIRMAAATRFIDMRRQRPRPRRDDAQVDHLRRAARSAGEAFAFEEEVPHASPRSHVMLVWIALAIVAAAGLMIAYS